MNPISPPTTVSVRTARRARRPSVIVPVVIAASLLLSACATGASDGGEQASSGDPVAGGTLTYGRLASANDLDLHQQITANNAFAIDKVFEPLVSFNETGEIGPWLAEDYDVNDTGTVYSFTLREGLQFSDSSLVTPADVVFSLNRHLEVGGPLPLEAPIDSIEAAGDREVTITLSEAYTPFLSELSGFSNGVLPEDFGGVTEEEFFEQPVGTGPFVVEEFDPEGDLTFVKNENYWQDGKPYLDGLVYKFIADDNQLQQQLIAGQIDAIESVPAANAAEIDSNAATALSATDGWSTEQVFFNTKNEYFADEHVRRAIAHAVDREGIVQATTFGNAEVANALLPPTIAYSANDSVESLAYDLDAAKKELAQSDYADGFRTKLLIASGNSQRTQIAQVLQESLAEIGITVEIEQIDIAAFRDRFRAFDYDFMINSGQSDAPDPNGFITFQADPEGFSQSYWTQYTNDEVTALMLSGRTTPEGDERAEIYREIQQILADDVPYIPLFFPANLKGSTADVQGLTVLPNSSVLFQDTWLSGTE